MELQDSVKCALESLKGLLLVVEGVNFGGPFENTAAAVHNDCFTVTAYNWTEEPDQDFNFKWGDFEVSWYKHFPRSATQNRYMGSEEVKEMLTECIQKILGDNIKGEPSVHICSKCGGQHPDYVPCKAINKQNVDFTERQAYHLMHVFHNRIRKLEEDGDYPKGEREEDGAIYSKLQDLWYDSRGKE